MKRLMIIVFLLFLALNTQQTKSAERYELQCDEALFYNSIDTLKSLVGTIEKTGKNDGIVINRIQENCGIARGAAYCNATQYYAFTQSAKQLNIPLGKIPMVRSGLANSTYNHAIKHGTKTTYNAQYGDLIVWRRGNTIYGHIGRIVEVRSMGWVITAEGNTTNGIQSGIFYKKRNIGHPLSRALQIRGLIGFGE